MILRHHSPLPLQILYSRIKPRHLGLRRNLPLRKTHPNGCEGLLYFVPIRSSLKRDLPNFLEDHIPFLQVYFLHFPSRVKPALCVRTARQVTPPLLILISIHRQILTEYAVDSCKRELDPVCKSPPILQIAR